MRDHRTTGEAAAATVHNASGVAQAGRVSDDAAFVPEAEELAIGWNPLAPGDMASSASPSPLSDRKEPSADMARLLGADFETAR
jgi:hypothetical protein